MKLTWTWNHDTERLEASHDGIVAVVEYVPAFDSYKAEARRDSQPYGTCEFQLATLAAAIHRAETFVEDEIEVRTYVEARRLARQS